MFGGGNESGGFNVENVVEKVSPRDEAALEWVGPAGGVRVKAVGKKRSEEFGVGICTRERTCVFRGACEGVKVGGVVAFW